jgi:hypothetical protein
MREEEGDREWYGALSDYRPLAEYSAAKIKRVQLNIINITG